MTRIKKGFALIEVLIASGILVSVATALTALSNSINTGTVRAADTSVANRLATEGLEKVSKARDDNFGTTSLWLSQAESRGRYGFYNTNTLTATGSIATTEVLAEITKNNQGAEKISLNNIDYYRYVCIESVGATKTHDKTNVYCNQGADNGAVNDGDRTITAGDTTCKVGDVYCSMVKKTSSSTIIPSGNAVKVRSIVVWQDKEEIRIVDLATLLTNWKGLL